MIIFYKKNQQTYLNKHFSKVLSSTIFFILLSQIITDILNTINTLSSKRTNCDLTKTSFKTTSKTRLKKYESWTLFTSKQFKRRARTSSRTTAWTFTSSQRCSPPDVVPRSPWTMSSTTHSSTSPPREGYQGIFLIWIINVSR